MTALAGTSNLLAQTYGTQGVGLVTYDAFGIELFHSDTVSDMDMIGAAGNYGVIANGTLVEIIDLTDHEPLASYTTLQPITSLNMAKEYDPTTAIFVNYLPLLTSN